MIDAIFRGISSLIPREPTSAPAPVLGGPHVDAHAGDVPPFVAGVRPVVVELEPAASDVALELDSGGAPAVDRGVCYHDLHVDHDGERFGLLVQPNKHAASMLPCPYVGKAGR